jgi:hypothetical protein
LHFPGLCSSGWPTLPLLEGRGFDFSFFPWPTNSFAITDAAICISSHSVAIEAFQVSGPFAREMHLSKRRAVDTLNGSDFDSGVAQNWAQYFVSEESEEATLLRDSGEPGRTRTYNPLIKSQLLYH